MEERKNMSFEEMGQFREKDLYVDCNFIVLQLASALNYLGVNGFDNALLEQLKSRQTYPLTHIYRFLVWDDLGDSKTKVVPNTDWINNFAEDYQKINNFLFRNSDVCCRGRVTDIYYTKQRAYVTVDAASGADYLLTINNFDTVHNFHTISIQFIHLAMQGIPTIANYLLTINNFHTISIQFIHMIMQGTPAII
jgi:hypothetical protein